MQYLMLCLLLYARLYFKFSYSLEAVDLKKHSKSHKIEKK